MAPKSKNLLKEPAKTVDSSSATNSNLVDSPLVKTIVNTIPSDMFVTDNINIDIQAKVAELVAQQFALQMANNTPVPVPHVNNEATLIPDTTNIENVITTNITTTEPTVPIAPADAEVNMNIDSTATVNQAPKHAQETRNRNSSPQARPSPRRSNSYERAKVVIEKMNNSDSEDEDDVPKDRWFYSVDKVIRDCVHVSEICTLFHEGIHCLHDLGLVIDDIGLLPCLLYTSDAADE